VKTDDKIARIREREYEAKLNKISNERKILTPAGKIDREAMKKGHIAEYKLAKEYPELDVNKDKIKWYE